MGVVGQVSKAITFPAACVCMYQLPPTKRLSNTPYNQRAQSSVKCLSIICDIRFDVLLKVKSKWTFGIRQMPVPVVGARLACSFLQWNGHVHLALPLPTDLLTSPWYHDYISRLLHASVVVPDSEAWLNLQQGLCRRASPIHSSASRVLLHSLRQGSHLHHGLTCCHLKPAYLKKKTYQRIGSVHDACQQHACSTGR